MTATETYAAEDQRAMMSTITGFWVSQLTATLAHLEIAEHLHDGPKTAARIAELAGSDPAPPSGCSAPPWIPGS
ncbi:hypothetical protein I8D64_09230 [Brachybacterium sp. MASK1Z-5]|uniref:Uncharacterized protein n=1 Tax=Brachybacterium halotolerans TaxID=2795215 RepID=A0ABS1BAA3_9MICO|nr:hypothetical protein [Brachybacterium halotolerans]MBK0331584.1 hypothetical protein [Brachybacterium halotolerans]